MSTVTLGELIGAHGVDVLDHLDREAAVPVLDGLQMQGDLAVIPAGGDSWARGTRSGAVFVQAEGLPVIEAVGGGHEHRLLPGAPGTVTFWPAGQGQDIGFVLASGPAYLAHPEHGYLGIAPGQYVLRRQREQADEERLIAD